MVRLIVSLKTAVAAGMILLTATVAAGFLRGQDKGREPAGALSRETRRASGSVSPSAAELQQRVDELSRQVEELTRMIGVLMARDSGGSVSGRGTSGEAIAARHAPAPMEEQNSAGFGSGNARSPKDGAATAPTPSASIQTTAATEATPKVIGPFRFSGDFRLRFDATLRPSYNSTGEGEPSLPHAQNIRGRYRLRFNFDTEINPSVSFHGQLATGAMNNPLTLDQDFSSTIARHPIMINEAWVDVHPVKGISLQGGKVQEVFADNLRFLFDDDITFNGFNERFSHEFSRPFAGFRRIEFRSGQYIFTNPNVAIVTEGNLGPAGAVIGSTGRASQMFHQGVLLEQSLSENARQQFSADVQLYRNPNQIQFASTAAGVPVLVQGGLGFVLAGPIPGRGNAVTTPGGAIYTAGNFQVARLSYRLDWKRLHSGSREYPMALNLQVARNIGTGSKERDALLATVKIGAVKERWDHSLLYLFSIKGANSMISQLTDDDLGTSTGVNIRSHYFRFDLGLAKKIQLQSLFFIQDELRSSGQFPNFFVPLGAFTPRQFRLQEQIVFTF